MYECFVFFYCLMMSGPSAVMMTSPQARLMRNRATAYDLFKATSSKK
jgi:hypothetical protein